VSADAGPERARAVSGYFLFAYLGFAVPPTMAGWLADRAGMETALLVFGVILVLVVALLLTLSVRSSYVLKRVHIP
jgi:MFS family permease